MIKIELSTPVTIGLTPNTEAGRKIRMLKIPTSMLEKIFPEETIAKMINDPKLSVGVSASNVPFCPWAEDPKLDKFA